MPSEGSAFIKVGVLEMRLFGSAVISVFVGETVNTCRAVGWSS